MQSPIQSAHPTSLREPFSWRRGLRSFCCSWFFEDEGGLSFSLLVSSRPSDVSSLPLAMASLPAAEDSPETAPEKPPDHRDSGLDFLRRSVAPVTPEPLVTAAVVNTDVNPSSSKEPQPAPNPAPSPAPFTLLPAIASSSKAPPSAVGSSGCNDAAPASEGRTAKKARTFVLRGKLQQSTLTFGGVRVPPPSAPEEEEPEPEEPEEIPVRADTNSPVLSRAELMEQKYIEASVKYNTQWLPKFPWLLLLRAKDGGPSVKCSVCLSFGKETTKYSGPGDGGRDLQTQTMRIHEHTSVHKEAMQRQAEIAEAISNGQTEIDRFMNADVEGRRAIRLMRSVQFLCQEDTPISMFPKLMRHLAEQDTPDIPKQAYGVYLTREALAVKDAATSNLDLAMVDTVVRTLAEHLGASSHWSQRFKYLQRVIYNTNLEVQGIHSVRWLSRGDAVKRLCKVLGAAIILFHEKEHDLYETVTSYKFQFCLFFLADILGDLNDLNRSFQKRRQRYDRKRKEKEPEEEEEPNEPAGEEEFAESDDDRDDNMEMDQEIEQSPPQDYSEDEDNPFLSDGEEEGGEEEMYEIDKPTE
ncbi:unnamed protein product [Closterium sp. Naga37s-1]|nr:unnamed protein product [Closterium sp. Naga37s-1]